MAITKIHSIKKTVKSAIKYIINENKTDDKLLVSTNNCTPELADLEFQMIRKEYDKDKGNLAFHLIQSFAPKEITAEKAHKIANELLEELDLKQFKAIVATHVDKNNIHNHIIFNAVNDLGKRYYDNKESYRYIKETSDKICENHKLSVIRKNNKEIKKEKPIKTNVWDNKEKNFLWRSKIKNDLDDAINKSNSFDNFLDIMVNEKNYEIKNNKYLSFKPKEKERFVRAKSLGMGYEIDEISKRIELNKAGYKIKTYRYKTKNKKYNDNLFDRKNIPYYTPLYKFLKVNILLIKCIKKRKNNETFSYKNDKKIYNLSNQLKVISEFKIDTISELKKEKNVCLKKTQDLYFVIDKMKKTQSNLEEQILTDDNKKMEFIKKKEQRKNQIEILEHEYDSTKNKLIQLENLYKITINIKEKNRYKKNLKEIKK